MWRLVRRYLTTQQPQVQPFSLELTLPRSNFLSDNELFTVAKELGSLSTKNLKENLNAMQHLQDYFYTLSTRIKKMQTSDISNIMKSIVKNAELRGTEFTKDFWSRATYELETRVEEFDLDLAADVAHSYCYIKYNGPEVNKFLNALAEGIGEFEISDYLNIPLHKIEDILWSYSFKNVGTMHLYKYLANAILIHPDFENASLQNVSKIAYYFSRAQLGRKYGGPEYFKKTEEIIWNGIHQGKVTKIEEIDDIIHYLIPANIGSNDLRALLEYTLFRLLTDPKQSITVVQLLKITTAFTHYIIKYEPLNLLLQQLAKDSLEILNAKQIVQILWAYTRHNKASKDFIYTLVNRLKTLLKTEKDLQFRNFTYLINSLVNSGIKDPEIWKHFDSISVNYLKESKSDDHYLIKFLSLYGGIGWENNEVYERGIKELLDNNRLPAEHPKDITRAVIATYETPAMQTPEFLKHLNTKIFHAANYMKQDEISNTVYSLALLNKGSLDVYSSLENSILNAGLNKIRPQSLGNACLGFGLVGMSAFCKSAMANVIDCFHKHQGRVYEDYESEDEEQQSTNKLILVNDKELAFNIFLTATSIVQMAWMAAAIGNREQLFWTDKLHESLIKIPMANYRYTINEWIWTAKTMQDEEDFLVALDPFHYGLLQQVLALIPPKGVQYENYIKELEEKVNSYPPELIEKMEKPKKITPEFLESVIETSKSLGFDVNPNPTHILGMKPDLNINGKDILLYDKDDYIYLSKGFYQLSGTKDLLTHLKLKKQIIKASGRKTFDIFVGDWNDLTTQEEKKQYLSALSNSS
ncbi:unnamed protein product [Blepharisma stoltei]|uniref:Uncharacterized protein n=1 Tax=Blepharisma stoltei TaxID=1481888 RepID=A0AAU9K5F3_9CILI|nr:unnamed protein product [Blepharisma stoltei]